MPYPLAAAKSRVFPPIPMLRDENNPYAGAPATPRLVQLHSHTNESDDGAYTPTELVSFYNAAGYTALAITGHDVITSQPAGMTVAIPASEYSPITGHVGGVGVTTYARGAETGTQAIINGILADGGIAILNHPNWSNGTIQGHTYAEIIALTGYAGIEIHNGVTVVQDNYGGYAVALWDQVLSSGLTTVWGFSGDDFHTISAVRAYNVGRVATFSDATLAGIVTALRAGCFVADVSNYGVTLNPPTVVGNTITLSCPGATAIRFIGTSGTLLSSTLGDTGEYTVIGDEGYVRAEVVGSYTEGFGADLDWVNRWAVDAGTWAIGSGILTQSLVLDGGPRWLALKRHILGDIEITCDGKYGDIDNQGGQFGIVFNSVGNGTGYYLRIKGSDATNTITIYKLPATLLGSKAASITYDTWYSCRIQYTAATGSIKARAWTRGEAEPATWDVEVTDTTLTSGVFALRTLGAASFDNLYINGFKSYYQPIGVTAP